MRLRATIPPGLEAERRHAVALVLEDILGFDVDIELDPEASGTVISVEGAGTALTVDDGFFATASQHWLTPASLPGAQPRHQETEVLAPGARLVESGLPILFDTVQSSATATNGGRRLRLDVFGTAFFLAARYEEVVVRAQDSHGRFPASASLAHRTGFLHRPLADEYAEVLWAAMRGVWPGLDRPQRRFRVVSTHDVDHPFQLLNCGGKDLVREAASRIRQRRDVVAALRTPMEWRRVRRDGAAHDPDNNFAAIMDADEAAGAHSAFYFMPDPDPTARIARRRYRLDDPAIGALLRAVHGRGHEIGLHPSYGAHLDADRLAAELAALRARCAALEIEQPQWGGRFHYLRWDAARSPALWSGAGLAYDSSVGFAEEPGFRAGTCHPHHLWDFSTRRRLPALERPLVVMDISLTAPKYLGLDAAAAARRIGALKHACRTVDGEFVVLWHNDVLSEPLHWELYQDAIARG